MVRGLLLSISLALGLHAGGAVSMADEAGLSLINQKERVEIPASSIRRIKARESIVFTMQDTRRRYEHKLPHVEVCLSKEIGEEVCRLTKRAGDSIKIVAGCEVVSEPKTSALICTQPCFFISVAGPMEAEGLARTLRDGSKLACAAPTS